MHSAGRSLHRSRAYLVTLRHAETRSADPDALQRQPTADLFEQYLGDQGGYGLFSLLSTGGPPGASRSFMFYGSAPSARVDFDFKGMHGLRAYWLSRSARPHIAWCRLVAPELDWPPDSEHVLGELQKRPLPLASLGHFISPAMRRDAGRLAQCLALPVGGLGR